MIRVFKRKPWKRDGNRYVPNGSARKTTIARVDTEDEARAMCKAHRESNPRPPSGTKGYYEYMYMEFERE